MQCVERLQSRGLNAARRVTLRRAVESLHMTEPHASAAATDGPDLAALKRRYQRLRKQTDEVRAEIKLAVLDAVRNHGVEEAVAARESGVDRMTVRAWLGKR